LFSYIVNGSEFKITQTVYNLDGSISYYDRHGIRIVFAQTGSIGKFNFISLLLNLVAALALFRVATLVVDGIMVYFLPQKKLYHREKFQETLDFNDEDLIAHETRKIFLGQERTPSTIVSADPPRLSLNLNTNKY
jgi:hypothetical protein